jgi:MFS family permease
LHLTLTSPHSGIADSMAQLIIGRLISGAGGAGMHVIVSFVIADLVPQRDIALYRSYVNIAQTAGRGFGGPMGGWLAVTVGWRG